MRALLMVALVAGCGSQSHPPDPAPKKELGCEDALRAASKNVPELRDAKYLGDTVSACISEQWPLDTRQCVAAVRDSPGFLACVMPVEQKRASEHLAITGIEPEKGDADGGTYVRIKGARFIADGARNVKVYFGTRQGTVVRFASDSELIVEAPGGKPDETVDVLVMFEPGGELKLVNGFTFVARK